MLSKLKHHAKRLLSKNEHVQSIVMRHYRKFCVKPDPRQAAVTRGMASLKQVLGMLAAAQVRSAAISNGALTISFRYGAVFNVPTRENSISGLLLAEGGYEQAETRFLSGPWYSTFYIGEAGRLVTTKGLRNTAINYYFSSRKR